MKKIILIFIVGLLSQISFSQEKVSYAEFLSNKEKEILNKKYIDFKTDSLTNDDLNNKVTIINFWYEGCAPCIAEMDALNKLYENNKENKNFQFISFCVDNIETIKKNVKKFNIEYSVHPIEKAKAYELNYKSGFPVTIITNTEGIVIHFSAGGFTDKTKATEKVMNVYDKIIGKELQKEQ